jgi:hypothetical protein
MLIKLFFFCVSTSDHEQATSKLVHLHVALSIACLWCSEYVSSIIGEIRFAGGLLITLFNIQMTQYWSIPLSCSGSSSCNCLPAMFHHDCLHEEEFLSIGSEFLIKLKKKFTTLYETPRFITAYTTARHLVLSWYWSIHFVPPIIFYKIHFNIILQIRIGISSNLSP